MRWSGGSPWDTSAPTWGHALPQELTPFPQCPRGAPTFPSSIAFSFPPELQLLYYYNTDVACSSSPISLSLLIFFPRYRKEVVEQIVNARLFHGSCYFQDVSFGASKNVSEHCVWAVVVTRCHRISSDDFLKQDFGVFLAGIRCVHVRN